MMSEIIIDSIVKTLKNNPVFNMSLSSKELFHSNVLAWLLEKYPDSDLAKLFIPEGYTVLRVLREWKNFDLFIICAKKEDKSLLSKFDFSEDDSDNNETISSNGLGIRIENQDFKDFKKLEEENENLSKKEKLNKSEQRKIDRFNELKEKENIIELDKLYHACANCKFIVIENKFKSIPYDKQLQEYVEKIENKKIPFLQILRISKKNIDINAKNTYFKLFAPKKSLDIFMGAGKRTKAINGQNWEGISYDDMCKSLSNASYDTFTKEFVGLYKVFVEEMLEITKKISENKEKVFPPEDDLSKFRTIRIHDFYEKLWFNAVMEKIKNQFQNTSNLITDVGYSNGMGMLNFMYNFDNSLFIDNDKEEPKVRFGIEIQAKQFRIAVYIINNKKYKWKSEADDKNEEKDQYPEIYNWLYKIYTLIEQDHTEMFNYPNEKDLELLKFAAFKYIKIPINEKVTVDILGQKIEKVLQIMKSKEKDFKAVIEKINGHSTPQPQ